MPGRVSSHEEKEEQSPRARNPGYIQGRKRASAGTVVLNAGPGHGRELESSPGARSL